MTATHWSIRQTDQRGTQIAALEALTGLNGPAAVIDFALASTLAQYRSAAGATEIAQAIRHIAERLAGAAYERVTWSANDCWLVDDSEFDAAIDALHALAEEIDHGSGADLEAYCDDGA